VLLDALVDGDAPDDVKALLLDRSGGNPFFLEELVSLLDESGMVGDAPSPDGAFHDLPDTLRGLVAARLDGLPTNERQTLVNAAVWGRRGPVEALEKMNKEDIGETADVGAALVALAEKEVLVVKARRWAFHSDLVRDVAYGTLTKGDRARKHAGIARYLAEHSGQEPDDRVVDIIAHHYAIAAELAGEMGAVPMVPDDVKDLALRWLTEAANRAEHADMHLVASRLWGQAVELAGPQHEHRTKFLLGRAHALTELRDLAPARVDVSAALADADAAGNRKAVAKALSALGDIEWREGDLESATTTLQRAIAIFEELGDREGVARAHRSLGMADLIVGEYRNARTSLEAALEASRAAEDVRGEAWALQNLAWIAYVDGRPDESEGRLHQSLVLFEQIGDQGGIGWAKGLLAWVKFHLGIPDEAEALIDDVLPDAHKRGDRWGEGMMLVLRAAMRLWSGRTLDAIETGEEALAVFREIDDRFGEFQALAPLGRALVAAGRVDEGFRILEGLLELEGAGDDLRKLAQTVVASAAVQVGEPTRLPAELICAFQEATAPATLGEGERVVALGLAALQRGDVADAVAWLEGVAEIEKDNPYAMSALAMALLAAGRADEVADAVATTWGSPRATYLDRARASLAAALAAGRAGDRDAAAEALAVVDGALDPTQDVVSQALAALGEAEVWASLGDPRAPALRSDAEARLQSWGLTGTGWSTVYALAAATA
jgi:tetratricopeptide (TPR) repeat protein